MLDEAARWSRVFFVAVGFFAFGVGGLLQLVVFPIVNFIVREPQVRSNLARDFIGWSFSSLIGFLRFTRVLDYKVTGAEKLQRRGLLILANHPTFLDIVFLMSLVKRADCIVKGALWRNPFFRGPVTAAGYIRNDDGEQLLADCAAALKRGENLIIFPEGTRTPSNGPLKLQRGAAHVALRARCNVTPVLIRCRPVMLARDIRWWKMPAERSKYDIEVKDDLDIAELVAAPAIDASLAARYVTDSLREFFKKEP